MPGPVAACGAVPEAGGQSGLRALENPVAATAEFADAAQGTRLVQCAGLT